MRLSTCLVTFFCCSSVISGESAQSLQALRTEAQAILAVRDALVREHDARITATPSTEPDGIFTVELSEAIAPRGSDDKDRRAVILTFQRRSGTWYPGQGSTPKYNKSQHVVDPKDMRLSGSVLTVRKCTDRQPAHHHQPGCLGSS